MAEFGGLLRLGPMDRSVLGAAVVGLVPTAWLAPGEELRVAAAGALAIAGVPLLAGDAEHGLRRLGAGLLGLVWLGALAGPAPSGVLALSANVSAFNLGNGLGAWLGGTTIDLGLDLGLGLGVRDVTLTAALATTTALLLSLAVWARTRRPDTRLPTLDTTPSTTDTPVHQKTP
ncbi:hypothetical protein ACFVIY_41365 [Streptomyces sp. NPDC127166]|uniref:hypothetical protein n=1 Tax=Streptomyces sp. NPDC127166 TaxID=3345380 RepID=UPI003625A653